MTQAAVNWDDRGPFVTTVLGKKFHLDDPTQDEIDAYAIAWSLSMQCRFNGHSDLFYSVAEHCLWVSYHVPRRLALEGLMHDAAEAYIGDIVRPMKDLLEMRAPGVLRDIENTIEIAIARKFNLRWPWPPAVKDADNAAAVTEAHDLMHVATVPQWREVWPGLPPVDGVSIVPMKKRAARNAWILRFNELRKERP
jgi:5'-deoxynucleotidase YfbR-like HD superfamily hydrolase